MMIPHTETTILYRSPASIQEAWLEDDSAYPGKKVLVIRMTKFINEEAKTKMIRILEANIPTLLAVIQGVK